MRHTQASPEAREGRAILSDTIVALVGLLTLTEYTFDVNLLIDHLLGAYPDRQAEFPGRMSPLTAMSFVLFGSAAMMPSSALPFAEYAASFILDAAEISDCSVALPVGPHLEPDDVQYVAEVLVSTLRNLAA